MAKQLNVALDFTANTTQAKQQIQELQQLLTKVAYSTDLGIDSSQMKAASAAAKELAVHLNEAYNQKTGNYDLSKLNASLAKSKTSVTELSTSLLQAGTTGQQAFIKLAQSIAAADQPMITLNARLQDFLTTVKNTVKWQISSSMIHGVMGALQGAYHYAQNLNSSLNDIRIVTGHNIDYMDKFADRANKAAKALSTSTLNYTDASLIYYQQGLSDKEVEDRTAVTIKMANAAGESADKISDQLTAVWNNFYDGSQSLEYYADVMTALGAATASSTDEIAAGLEKFAAVSNTVGLSYEYATSALATVTATTRQSADVVGTAFKTLFARIQDLELGKTLEDGTTLGKYSQALDTVGISIKTADGGLREMDDILSDLGEKWNSFDAEGNPLISKDAKVALAQTVAGVRQYTQLMALMDNWDFMKENLETARNATGTLTEQQKIYEESWQAANKRLKASFESLYTDLIDDKFFIKFTDFLSDMVNGVDSFIDKIGGIKPLLLGFLSLIGQTLSSKIQPALDNAINNIQILVGGADKVYAKISKETSDNIKLQLEARTNFTPAQEQELKNSQELLGVKNKLATVSENLSVSEKRYYENEIQFIEKQQQETVKLIKLREQLNKDTNPIDLNAPNQIYDYGTSYLQKLKTNKDKAQQSYRNNPSESNQADLIAARNDLAFFQNDKLDIQEQAASQLAQTVEKLTNAYKTFIEVGHETNETLLSGNDLYSLTIEGLKKLGTQYTKLNGEIDFETVRTSIDMLIGPVDEVTKSSKDFQNALEAIESALDGGKPKEVSQAFNQLAEVLKNTTVEGKNAANALEQMGRSTSKSMKQAKGDIQAHGKVLKQWGQATKEAKEAQEGLNQAVINFKPIHKIPFTQSLISLASACGSAAMTLQSFNSIMQTLSDPDISGWEKFTSVLFSISMIVPGVSSVLRGLGTANAFLQQQSQKQFLTLSLENVAIEANTIILTQNQKKKIDNILASKKLNDAFKKNAIQAVLAAGGVVTETTALQAEAIVAGKATVTTNAFSTALKGLWLNIAPVLATIWPLIVALGALVAAWAIYNNATGAAAENAEQNNKNLEETKTALDDVNSRLNTLNSTLSGLNDKRKNIDNLTYGTIEWRNAVNELNDEVDDLIEKYGLIKGQDWDIDAQGRKYITDTGAETMRTSMDEERSNLLSAKAAQQKFKDKYEYDQSKREIISDYTKRGQTHYDNDVEQITSKDLDTIINAKLRNPNLEIDSDTLKDLGLDQSVIDLIDNNTELQDAIKELTIQAQRIADTETNDMYNKMVSDGILEDLKEAGVSDEYASDIAYKMAEDAARNSNAIDYTDQSATAFNVLNNSNENIQEFLKERGYTYKDNNFWGNLSKLQNDKTIEVYTDEDQKETKNISVSELRAWLENKLAAEDTVANIDDYVGIEADSKTTWENASKAKETWNKNQSTVNEFEQINQQGTPNEDSFDNTEDYQAAYNNYQDQLKEKAQAMSDMLKQNSEEYASMFDMTKEGFEEWISDSDNIIEHYDLIKKAVEGDAEAVNELRKLTGLNIGTIKDIQDAWNDNSKELDKYIEKLEKNQDLTEAEYESFGDFLNANSDSFASLAAVSEDTFDKMLSHNKDFIKKSGPLIPKMMKGDTKAVQQFRVEAQRQIVLDVNNTQARKAMAQLEESAGAAAGTVESDVQNAFDYISNYIENNPIEVGAEVNDAGFIDACNKIIAASGWTSEQAQKEFAKMGFNLELNPVEPQVTKKHFDTLVATNETDTVDGTHHVPGGVFIKSLDGEDVIEYPAAVKAVTGGGLEMGGEVTGGTKPSGVTGGNGGGGSSGGGGGSSYTPPPKKEYKDEIERYHVIKQKIEDLEEVMEHLAKAKERAFGTSKLELMDQEIEKYDEMIDLQNQYLDEINKYWDEDRALIASYGAEFDETGAITNYDEIMKRQIDKYNSSIGKNEDADNAAEEAYDDFIEALEQYEETNNLRQDELEKLYDLQTELADVIFEKTQYKIEIKIAVKDDELEYLDYLLSKIEDDAYSAAEAIALIGDKTQNTLDKITTYQKGLMKLLNNHGIDSIEELEGMSEADLKAKGFTTKEIEQLRDWRSELLSNNQELLEMRNTIQEKVLDSFNQFSEDIEHQIELFDHYQNILEGVKDITSLLGMQLGEQSKIVIRNLNRSLMNNSINNLAGTKKELEALKQMRADAQAERDKVAANGDEQAIKKWDKTLQEIDDKINGAEESFLDSWQEALQRAKDIFNEEMDNIIQEFEKGIAPIQGTIDALQEAIDQANEIDAQYLSDTDKTYELNKLRRQIEGSIEDTDIIVHKQALNKLQDELNKKLKDGSQISEYDLKILQSKYELELARQKLEDTQNNSEVVRLTRDNNGNWGYVYSADEDKIAEAEQAYEDKLNAYQKANEEYLKTLESNILQVQADYKEKLKEIELGLADGEITKEEAEARIANLNDWYLNKMQYLEGEYKKLFENSQDATEKFTSYYQTNTDNIKNTFEKTTLAIKGGYESLDAMFKRFWESHDNVLDNSMKLLDDLSKKQDEINQTAGIEGSFANEASGWSIKITGDSDKALADMDGIVKNATDSFKDVIEAAGKWEKIYSEKINSAIDRNEALVISLNKMVTLLSGIDSIDYSKYGKKIDSRATATDNNIISTQHNSKSFNSTDYIAEQSFPLTYDIFDRLDMSKQIDEWMQSNELTIDTALIDSLDVSSILQSIGLNVQTIVNYLSNLTPSSLGIDRIAQELMQQVSINADFPNVTDSNEIMEAFEMMENEASQYASRKTI